MTAPHKLGPQWRLTSSRHDSRKREAHDAGRQGDEKGVQSGGGPAMAARRARDAERERSGTAGPAAQRGGRTLTPTVARPARQVKTGFSARHPYSRWCRPPAVKLGEPTSVSRESDISCSVRGSSDDGEAGTRDGDTHLLRGGFIIEPQGASFCLAGPDAGPQPRPRRPPARRRHRPTAIQPAGREQFHRIPGHKPAASFAPPRAAPD